MTQLVICAQAFPRISTLEGRATSCSRPSHAVSNAESPIPFSPQSLSLTKKLNQLLLAVSLQWKPIRLAFSFSILARHVKSSAFPLSRSRNHCAMLWQKEPRAAFQEIAVISGVQCYVSILRTCMRLAVLCWWPTESSPQCEASCPSYPSWFSSGGPTSYSSYHSLSLSRGAVVLFCNFLQAHKLCTAAKLAASGCRRRKPRGWRPGAVIWRDRMRRNAIPRSNLSSPVDFGMWKTESAIAFVVVAHASSSVAVPAWQCTEPRCQFGGRIKIRIREVLSSQLELHVVRW